MQLALRRTEVAAAVLVCALAGPGAGAQTCDGIAPASTSSLVAVEVATGLIHRPDFAVNAPGDHDRLFILQQDGVITLKKRGNAPTTTSTFLDIITKVTSGSETGLLGLAFDPDYATTGHFYVNYTERVGGQTFTVVAQYSVSANPDVADAASEVRVLRLRQPQTNHNGGQVEFGPDGYLYIWTGDGGNADDSGAGHAVCGNGQSKTTILGKMLRIDVRGIAPSSVPPDCGGSGAGAYRIPTDNPIDDGPGGNCDEIYAWGLRNPWRNTWDSLTGELYIADVGQNCTEELNFVPSPGNGGQNFGWRVMEGGHCFNTTATSNCDPPGQSCAGSPPCDDPSLTDPVLDYDHGGLNECAITGGFVYRGCKMPALSGTYFYGDYCAGFVRSLVMSGGVPTNETDWTAQLDPGGALAFGLGSFGRDAEGEIYVVSLGGDVEKIVPPLPALEVSAPGAADQLLLSKTGDWTWQDLHRETDHPVTAYRVYRGTPNGAFGCVHKATDAKWAAGGDVQDPAAGSLFGYVVTAVNADSQETAKGAAGTFDASGCP